MSTKSKPFSVAAPEGMIHHIDLDSLEFDPENPRTVEQLGREASQGKIEEHLLGGDMKARDLVPSSSRTVFLTSR